jgi:hydroxyacylglutathione hydrolase
MSTPFQLDHAPVHGSVENLQDGVRCVTAPNTSPMTFTGTRTYIIGHGDVALIDPGPDLEAHHSAILAAISPGERISHILLTHSHVDHSAGVPALKAATGAEVMAFGASSQGRSPMMSALAQSGLGGGEGIDHAFVPDRCIADGESVSGPSWQLVAHHTPGHISNHLCFVWDDAKAVFSGDHVMGWATTLVSPPDGDLTAFMASLDLAEKLSDGRVLYPGHGAPVSDGVALIRHIRTHRQMREGQILAALADQSGTARTLTERIYTQTPPALHAAAARNVFAHLLDLLTRGRVSHQGPLSFDAPFHLASE